MRLVPALIGIFALFAAGSAGAQVKSPVSQPTLPQPKVLQDTILISTFDLDRGSSGGFQLRTTFLGLAPPGYRVSAYRDFRDSTGKYVSSTVARDSLCITFG